MHPWTDPNDDMSSGERSILGPPTLWPPQSVSCLRGGHCAHRQSALDRTGMLRQQGLFCTTMILKPEYGA